ncbi:jg13593 [Pararge aegeria aegeria]|uniref:Jg13593 protein n=1 Tax=Pararge aegeria aegeria TaxID=348720 RepID=A0A8S4QWL0_9NEOP|nr:jg13593 [Pararge aegeria aegeria]
MKETGKRNDDESCNNDVRKQSAFNCPFLVYSRKLGVSITKLLKDFKSITVHCWAKGLDQRKEFPIITTLGRRIGDRSYCDSNTEDAAARSSSPLTTQAGRRGMLTTLSDLSSPN